MTLSVRSDSFSPRQLISFFYLFPVDRDRLSRRRVLPLSFSLGLTDPFPRNPPYILTPHNFGFVMAFPFPLWRSAKENLGSRFPTEFDRWKTSSEWPFYVFLSSIFFFETPFERALGSPLWGRQVVFSSYAFSTSHSV